ncbi:TPA: LOW QUALITY PROTEIN: hypothetical protein N0F65_000447, partial [Lagenidium giganteum]
IALCLYNGAAQVCTDFDMRTYTNNIKNQIFQLATPPLPNVLPINQKHALLRRNNPKRLKEIQKKLFSQPRREFQKVVDNLIYQIKRAADQGDENDRVAAAQLNETDRQETGVISLTSLQMREMYGRFPEMPIQHSLLANNSDWRALDHSARVLGGLDSVRVAMVDKELQEIKMVQRYFSKARPLICRFHWLYTQVGKPSWQALIGRLRICECTPRLRRNLAELEARLEFTLFMDYFRRNWDSCRDMLVMPRRKKLPHFSQKTNNMMERWFKKMKVDVNGTIDEASLAKKSKYGPGKEYTEFWVFGGYDRNCRKWFAAITFSHRTKPTLTTAIAAMILPQFIVLTIIGTSTHIISDQFVSYVSTKGKHILANTPKLKHLAYTHTWLNPS